LFSLYFPHPLIVLPSFYLRGLLNIPAASRSFIHPLFISGSSQLQKYCLKKNPVMFTPPPSPLPQPFGSFHYTDPPVPSPSPSPPPPSSLHRSPDPVLIPSQPPPKSGVRGAAETSMLAVQDRKRRTAWLTGLTVIIIPLLLALFTLLTRLSPRPLFLDSLAGVSPETRVNLAIGNVRTGHLVHALHRRETGVTMVQSDEPSSTSSAAGVDFPPPTSTSSLSPSGSVPTIPSSPPVLPTPFPQPFETTLSLNFTTNSCKTFFLNMTQSLPFRQCRPFSLLSQTSTSFLQVSALILFMLRTICLNLLVDTYLRHSRTSRRSTLIFGALVTLPWTWISARLIWDGSNQSCCPHAQRRRMLTIN